MFSIQWFCNLLGFIECKIKFISISPDWTRHTPLCSAHKYPWQHCSVYWNHTTLAKMDSISAKVIHIKFQQNVFKFCGLHGKIHWWSNETWIYVVRNVISQLLMEIQTSNKNCEMFCVIHREIYLQPCINWALLSQPCINWALLSIN
jgi:hypothetical protein